MASAVTHGTSWTSIDVSERQMGAPPLRYRKFARLSPLPGCGRSTARRPSGTIVMSRSTCCIWQTPRSTLAAQEKRWTGSRARCESRGVRTSRLSPERTRLGSGFRSSQKSESDFQRFLDDSGLGKRGFARKINAVRWTSLGCRLENGPLFPGRRPTKRLVLCIFFECAFGRGGSFSRPIK